MRVQVAICVYNGAGLLTGLVEALRAQPCDLPVDILVVDNNSSDATSEVAERLAQQPGTALKLVRESRQGIPFARNCAIDESLDHDILAFIDIDELPGPRWLQSAVDCLLKDGADCAGGEIRVILPTNTPPAWLTEELKGFLGAVSHGSESFQITDRSTPVWSGNVAYRMDLFRDGLRFDTRYNRAGNGVGGGEDAMMFRGLLAQQAHIRYQPDMLIEHHVDAWKMQRRYFLRLHYNAGCKFGRYETGDYATEWLGIPPFMLRDLLAKSFSALGQWLGQQRNWMRQAMTAAYALGSLRGRLLRRQDLKSQAGAV